MAADGDPMIDTTSPHGRLILALLGALAEFEGIDDLGTHK
jgi:DNA invertase Pin-like site-specific DNA recombinase